MKIYACPRCGSKEIFMGTIDSGVLIGMTSNKNVCKNCGFQGNPIIFESEQQYQQFLEEIKKHEPSNKTNSGNVSIDKENLSEKDELVLDYIEDIKKTGEFDQESQNEEKSKNWWPEMIIAMSISIISGIWIYPNLVTVMITPYLTVYLVGYIIITFLITLIFILILEYVLKSINNKIFHFGNKY
jgi:transcription elongation factor Elf1